MISKLNIKTVLNILLVLACTSCQNTQPEAVPSQIPLPTLPPQTLKLDRTPKNSPLYQQAIEATQRATQLSRQAQSIEDWQAVTQQWQSAMALMRQVPAQDPNHTAAVQSMALVNEGIARSKAEAKRLQENAIAKAANQTAQDKAVQTLETVTQRLKDQGDRLAQGKPYYVPIKSYNNGIPVIEVMFNGVQRFEMMVDTGASNTMITEPMSKSLKVEISGSVMAKTPGGDTPFPVGRVTSIAVGESSSENLPVAIGPVGLLGHDFFGDCNINIKRDQNIIEFSQCN
jgi:predicted aspartyl protease